LPTIKEGTPEPLKRLRRRDTHTDARTARRLARDNKKVKKNNIIHEARQLHNHRHANPPTKSAPTLKNVLRESTTDNIPTPTMNPGPIPITQEEGNAMNHVTETKTAASTYDSQNKENVHTQARYTYPKWFEIHHNALYHVVGQHIENCHPAFVPDAFAHKQEQFTTQIPLEPMANGVVRPMTGETINKYEKLIQDITLKATWMNAMCKELGCLTKGYEDEKGTETVHFMTVDEIKNLPKSVTRTHRG